LICIRKHRQKNLRLPDLVEEGMLDQRAARQLESWAAGGATVLFSGRGAAGKTTLLRAFLEALPKLERVLVAESDSELYPDKPGCLLLRVKKAQEGGRPVTLRDLVSDGLTMSLDTYCIGEIVGEEALEFIQAAFSGHRCLATIHADCAADALDRLLLLARPAGGSQDVKVLKRMLGRCIDYIVHLKDFAVEQILQVRGFLEGEDAYAMVTVWPENPCPAAGPAAGQPAVPLVPGQGGSAFCLCEMPGQRVGQSDAASGR
jgi:pilus assembly protein CpaF